MKRHDVARVHRPSLIVGHARVSLSFTAVAAVAVAAVAVAAVSRPSALRLSCRLLPLRPSSSQRVRRTAFRPIAAVAGASSSRTPSKRSAPQRVVSLRSTAKALSATALRPPLLLLLLLLWVSRAYPVETVCGVGPKARGRSKQTLRKSVLLGSRTSSPVRTDRNVPLSLLLLLILPLIRLLILPLILRLFCSWFCHLFCY